MVLIYSCFYPFIKDAINKIHLQDLPKGTRIAIDASSWIHQILHQSSVAVDIVYSRPTDELCHKFIDKLVTIMKFSLVPVVVFDGKNVRQNLQQIWKEKIRGMKLFKKV